MSPTQAGPTTNIRLPAISGLLVQPLHVFLDTLFYRHELVVAAGGAEIGEVRFREALVATLEHVREGDVFDLALAEVLDHGLGHVVEGLGAAGAEVEYPRDFGVLPKPQVHRAHIVHVDEVAALLALAVAVTALEQLALAGLEDLVVEVEGGAGHLALVLLAGTVHVEVTEAHHLALEARLDAPAQVLVEQEFEIAVHVQGRLMAPLLLEHLAAAIDRRGGCIDEGD